MAQSTTYARPQPDHTKDEPAPAERRASDSLLDLTGELLAAIEALAVAVPSMHGYTNRIEAMRIRYNEMRVAK